MLVISFN